MNHIYRLVWNASQLAYCAVSETARGSSKSGRKSAIAPPPPAATRVILPHELAHQIDFNLNGWYDRKPHHCKTWQVMMHKIGLPADPYHTAASLLIATCAASAGAADINTLPTGNQAWAGSAAITIPSETVPQAPF